jgi:hypothetical protein
MWKSAGRAPSLRVFTLAFALQLRKKHGKTTVRVRETSVRLRKTSVRLIKTSVRVQYTYYQDTHTLQNRHKHTHTHTHILQNPHTYIYTHTHITKQYKTTTLQIKTNSTRSNQMMGWYLKLGRGPLLIPLDLSPTSPSSSRRGTVRIADCILY